MKRVFERVAIIGLNSLVIGAALITGASVLAYAISSASFFADNSSFGYSAMWIVVALVTPVGAVLAWRWGQSLGERPLARTQRVAIISTVYTCALLAAVLYSNIALFLIFG